eukprot:1105173-Rhodomonas_salina.1
MALLPALKACSVAQRVPCPPPFTCLSELTPWARQPLTASAQCLPERQIMLGLPAVLLVKHLFPVLLGLHFGKRMWQTYTASTGTQSSCSLTMESDKNKAAASKGLREVQSWTECKPLPWGSRRNDQ